MVTLQDLKTKIRGYGSTQEEAELDLRFNLARHDITTSQEFSKRREELVSWLPTSDSLSICGRLTINYADGYLHDIIHERSVKCVPRPLAHFVVLYPLLAPYVSYKDFCITIAREVNEFLNNINPCFGEIDDFPYIQQGRWSTPKEVHFLKSNSLIAITETDDLIAVSPDSHTAYIEAAQGIDIDCLTSYAFASLGCIFDGINLTFGGVV